MLTLRDLSDGERFRFIGYPNYGGPWIARGNGWYSSPEGYDGGPWYAPERHVERWQERMIGPVKYCERCGTPLVSGHCVFCASPEQQERIAYAETIGESA